jgi:hypothetical protein
VNPKALLAGVAWLSVVVFLIWNALAQIQGNTASGPCSGTRSASARSVHLEPGLFTDASWAEFNVSDSADHLVVCQDGQALSYRILDRQDGRVRMRIGNRWVLSHALQLDLDIYAAPERWQILVDDS